MIPKTIHYCWFGGNPKPELICKCIDSWHNFLPDYEIIEWNEDNFDVTFCKFTEDAYHAKKWAFVSDVARLKVIYEHGGIYMDTDVELLANNPFEAYLGHNAFMFFVANVGINTGVGFGAKPKDALIKKILDSYENIVFTPERLPAIACPALNTPVVQNALPDLSLDNSNQIFEGYAFISEAEYWKFARHYCAFSWRTQEQDHALKYARKNIKTSKFRKALQSPRIFAFFQKHNLVKVSSIYKVIVYDLFDYGLLYWLVRLKLRMIRIFVHK